MFLRHFLLLIIAVHSTSCTFKDRAKKGNPAAAPFSDSDKKINVLGADNDMNSANGLTLQTSFVELPEPGSYLLRISAPEGVTSLRVLKQGDVNESVFTGNVAEIKILQSQNYVFKVRSLNSQGEAIEQSLLRLTAPVDVFIDQPLFLSQDEVIEARRIYFASTGLIQTNGRNLKLKSRYLEVLPGPSQVGDPLSSAQIRTTTLGTLYRDEQQKQGSNIEIEAEEARGVLRVALVGFDGQSGRSGNELDLLNNVFRGPDPLLNGQMGSQGSRRDMKCTQRPIDGDCADLIVCHDEPTNGTDGKQGARGTNGEDAQDGGDAGHFSVNISRSEEFQIDLTSRRGEAGKPGLGGEGSPGGLAGRAHPTPVGGCPRAQDGKPGKNGERGSDGKVGVSGKDAIYMAPSSVRIQTRQL